MAKGNDGNLLQHGIEAELAWKLYQLGGNRSLHLVSTHGMAPEECWEAKRAGHRLLTEWVGKSSEPTLPKTFPCVALAYRECQATPFRYPNTGEIIAALIGRANIEGLIVEKDSYKHTMLEYKWQGYCLDTICDSWRKKLNSLFPSEGPTCPWLFSMDPMTFQQVRGDKDDANLYPEDLSDLESVFKKYISSGQPGAISIFCYSLKQLKSFNQLQFFKNQMRSLAKKLAIHCQFFGVRRSNVDLGAILATDPKIIAPTKAAWKKLIPVNKRVS